MQHLSFRRRARASAPLAILLGLATSCASVGPNDTGARPGAPAAATPQRPTLSSDTNTTAEGTLEFEAGLTLDPGDSVDTPTALKLGIGPATEAFLGWSPLVYVERPGSDEAGIGDLSFGARHRFGEETDSAPASAVQASVKLPTADDKKGLGSGELDASLAGILTKTFGDYPVTAFYSLNAIGQRRGGTAIGHSLAIATATPAQDHLSLFGELAGVFVPETDVDQVFTTIGFTFTPNPSTVFDCGVLVGLSPEAPDFQVVVGLTQNLGPTRSLLRR